MLAIDRPFFAIRMHPVHKLFGMRLVPVCAVAAFSEMNAEQAAVIDQAARRLEQGPKVAWH